ncbi:hypothetical protein C7I85_03950 [Mesorhizobium soli]|uniref:Uncharacterized protein n=1 Tax=Pseudaminobacter soli (ex Li et al. 2025) TaxID=1295366 RepID=A0A2P7SK83_9HYPH|nr:hypothetical protein C7I85_03950 [Mesorhizobium soli]
MAAQLAEVRKSVTAFAKTDRVKSLSGQTCLVGPAVGPADYPEEPSLCLPFFCCRRLEIVQMGDSPLRVCRGSRRSQESAAARVRELRALALVFSPTGKIALHAMSGPCPMRLMSISS